MRTTSIFAIKDGNVYRISYTAEPEKLGYYLPTFEDMVNSIHVKGG